MRRRQLAARQVQWGVQTSVPSSSAHPTDHQIDQGPEPSRCNFCALAGHEASFPHWHFCELVPEHEGPHPCMSCHAEFGR
jgi:hypothetical protein